jgi:hypothetical protein
MSSRSNTESQHFPKFHYSAEFEWAIAERSHSRQGAATAHREQT